MKVLLLHQHFKTPYAGGAIRSYYLAAALVSKGIEVIVITAHNEKYRKELLDGIEIHYLNVPYSNRYGFVKRSISFLRYIFKAVKKTDELNGISLCYAISVPLTVGIAARRIKKRHGIPYIFEVGDLWPDAPIQMGFVKNYFFKQRLFALEKRIYQSATSIVALSPAIQSAIAKKVEDKKIAVIPNMADLEYFEKATKDARLVLQFKVQQKFVVSYIGALGAANGLDYILECANAARKTSLPIQFIICGDGALKATLSTDIQRLELENVTLLEFTNREGVKDIFNISDASFICYQPVPILETGSPNKFFDALAAGKLCVVNFGGWIRDEIESSNCGIYVDPHQPSDFVKKINPFLTDRLLLENYQFNARTLAEKKFSRASLSQKFADLVVDTIGS